MLVDENGDEPVNIASIFNYDAFGNALGFVLADAGTSLLYRGEQTDQQTAMQYLRARYYTSNNARFISWDPYDGDIQDPQSLHKYLYCHSDPIGNIDPTGMFSLLSLFSGSTFSNFLRRMNIGFYLNAYGYVDDVVTSFNVAYQWMSTGKADWVSLGSLALSLVPFGKVLGKVKIGANKIFGVSDDLTRFYRAAGKRTNKIVQAVGDMGAELVARSHNMVPTGFVARYHGFDAVYQAGERFVIVEAKGGTSRLAKGQMSKKWIEERIIKMMDDLDNVDLGDKLWKAYNAGKVDGMVVTTKIVNNTVQDPTFVYKAFETIGEFSF